MLTLILIALAALYRVFLKGIVFHSEMAALASVSVPVLMIAGVLMVTRPPAAVSFEVQKSRLFYSLTLVTCFLTMIIAWGLHILAPTHWLSWIPGWVWGGVQENIQYYYLLEGASFLAFGDMAMSTVAAPVCEELFFRRRLYGPIAASIGNYRATLVSTALFVAMHTAQSHDWLGFLQIAAWGVCFTQVYRRSGSIKMAMLTHTTVNFTTACAVIGYYRLHGG